MKRVTLPLDKRGHFLFTMDLWTLEKLMSLHFMDSIELHSDGSVTIGREDQYDKEPQVDSESSQR